MSAGSTMLTRYLGQEQPPVIAGMSICNGFRSKNVLNLERGTLKNRFYSWAIAKKMGQACGGRDRDPGGGGGGGARAARRRGR